MKTFIERRKQRRLAVNIPANVVSEDGLKRLAVAIVDLSPAGALIELPAGAALPTRFTLLFERQMQSCRLVWTHEQFGGAEFM